jgi:Replication initiator protein, pSAM2
VTGDPAALRALLAEITASALGTDVPPGHPDAVTARLLRPDFTHWRAHAARARGCSRPVRLRGSSTTVAAETGEVLETFDTDELPDATL